jgi:hypothetical protein
MIDLDSQSISRRRHCGCSNKEAFHLVPNPGCHIRRSPPGSALTRSVWYSMLLISGSLGVAVDARWRDFRLFLADMGPRPSPAHGIGRVGSRGAFAPGNCVWITLTERVAARAALKHGPRVFACEDFMVGGAFDWDRWRAAGSPDYEPVAQSR